MRNILLIAIISILWCCSVFSNDLDDSAKVRNAIYADLTIVEFYFLNFNYERILYEKKIFRIGQRIGIGTIASPYSLFYWNLNVPVETNVLLGLKSHFLEVGTGLTGYSFFGFSSGQPDIMWAGRLGYRYQEENGGLMLRLGFTPQFGRTRQIHYSYPDRMEYTWQRKLVPIGSISVGKTF